MKNFKKMAVAILAVVVITAMSMMSIFAQDVGFSGSGSTTDGKIIIENAAKGESYSIYKLFDATLGASGAIAYKGDIPSSLSAYFVPAGSGTDYVKYNGSGSEMPPAMRTALANWTKEAGVTPLLGPVESDGTVL